MLGQNDVGISDRIISSSCVWYSTYMDRLGRIQDSRMDKDLLICVPVKREEWIGAHLEVASRWRGACTQSRHRIHKVTGRVQVSSTGDGHAMWKRCVCTTWRPRLVPDEDKSREL